MRAVGYNDVSLHGVDNGKKWGLEKLEKQRKRMAELNITVHIGDQADPEFLANLAAAVPEGFDVLMTVSSIQRGVLERQAGETLEGSFSAVSKPIFASNCSFESSCGDLHSTHFCTDVTSQKFN